MALPVIGGLGDLNASNNTALNSQRWAAEQLSNLGGKIAASLATNRAQQEAAGMAPLFAQQYKAAYDDIAKGNYGSGIGTLLQLQSVAGSNPFLAHQNDQAIKAGLDFANISAADLRQKAGFDQAYGLEATRYQNNLSLQQMRDAAAVNRDAARQKAMDDRQAKNAQDIADRQAVAIAAANERQDKRVQATQNQPPTPLQKAELVGKVNTAAQAIIAKMGSAKTPEDFIKAYEQYIPYRDAAAKAGADAQNPYFEEQAAKHLEELHAKLEETAKQIEEAKAAGKDPSKAGWFSKSLTQTADDLKKAYDRLSKDNQKAIKEGYSAPDTQDQQAAQPSAQQPSFKEGQRIRQNGKVYVIRNGTPVPE